MQSQEGKILTIWSFGSTRAPNVGTKFQNFINAATAVPKLGST